MKNKQNFIFICIIVCLCAFIYAIGLLRKQGSVAIVQFGNGDTERISLSQAGVHTLQNGELPVHLEVQEGKIRFANSECPDHVCEGFGWLSKEEDQAICAPARASVSIEP